MKKKIMFMVNLYISILLFYGIILKLTFKLTPINKIIKYIPETILSILILMCFFQVYKRHKYKYKYKNVFLYIYISSILLLGLLRRPSIESILFIIRDLYLPIVLFYFLSNINFTKYELELLYLRLLKIFTIFIISGFILSVFQHYMGWEWTSKFYTGYSFYGLDETSKILISKSNNILRVPSLTGNSASFSFYNLISCIFILYSNKSKLYKVVLSNFALLNIILSTNKTALIIAIIILSIKLLKDLNVYFKCFLISLLIILVFISIAFILLHKPYLLFSFSERLRLWKDLINIDNLFNIFLPTNVYIFSGTESGIYGFLDNTYFFYLLGTGIVGIIAICNMFILSIKRSEKEYYYQVRGLALIFVFGGMTTNLIQGRVFMSICLIVLGIFSFNNKSITEIL